jgi:hypothetical protein
VKYRYLIFGQYIRIYIYIYVYYCWNPATVLSWRSQGTERNLAGLSYQLLISVTSFVFLLTVSPSAAVLVTTHSVSDCTTFSYWAAVCGKVRIHVRVVAVMLTSARFLAETEWDWCLPASSFRVIHFVSGMRILSLPLGYCKFISKCVCKHKPTQKENVYIVMIYCLTLLLSNLLCIWSL